MIKIKTVLILLLFFSATLIILSCNATDPGNWDDNNLRDTTSHNFTWQTWTFGEHSGSILYDVAIIDENNIWAVGEIYMNDSTEDASAHPYNAAHWDGIEWELLKIPTLAWNSTDVFWSDPLKAIWAFSKNDIWVTTGGQVINYNGNAWGKHKFLSTNIYDSTLGSINSLWGNNNKLWAVGNRENIWLQENERWQKIHADSKLDAYNIYGSTLGNDNIEIYSVAAKHTANANKKILKIESNSVKDISTVGIFSSISSIWFKPGKKYYVVGSGIYSKNEINSDLPWHRDQDITKYYLYSIDGQTENDIAACGSYGELLHFNGARWKSYKEEVGLNAGAYFEVKIKDNFIIAVGYDSPKAVITIGKR